MWTCTIRIVSVVGETRAGGVWETEESRTKSGSSKRAGSGRTRLESAAKNIINKNPSKLSDMLGLHIASKWTNVSPKQTLLHICVIQNHKNTSFIYVFKGTF